MTQSASSCSSVTSDAVSRPSSPAAAVSGGLSTIAGSARPDARDSSQQEGVGNIQTPLVGQITAPATGGRQRGHRRQHGDRVILGEPGGVMVAIGRGSPRKGRNQDLKRQSRQRLGGNDQQILAGNEVGDAAQQLLIEIEGIVEHTADPVLCARLGKDAAKVAGPVGHLSRDVVCDRSDEVSFRPRFGLTPAALCYVVEAISANSCQLALASKSAAGR